VSPIMCKPYYGLELRVVIWFCVRIENFKWRNASFLGQDCAGDVRKGVLFCFEGWNGFLLIQLIPNEAVTDDSIKAQPLQIVSWSFPSIYPKSNGVIAGSAREYATGCLSPVTALSNLIMGVHSRFKK